MARVSQSFCFPYVVRFLQTSDPPSASSVGHDLTTYRYDNRVFELSEYRFRSPVWGWRLIAQVVDSIIDQIMDTEYLLTPYIHDGIKGSERHDIHELGMDLCRIKRTLEQKSSDCLLLVTSEISARFEHKILAIEVNLPPQALHFIDPLLKVLDLDILNPLSTLGCLNAGVALDLDILLRFFRDQNFPPSQWVGSVVWPSLMNSIMPRQSLSLFLAPQLSINLTEDMCDCQVWALDLGTMVAFQFFIKSQDGKSILF